VIAAAVIYGIGFLIAPFVVSLVDGYPFVKPRLDALDESATFFISLIWPLCLVAWVLTLWWVFSCTIGKGLHDLIVGRIPNNDSQKKGKCDGR
jgi:hypothetical protein